MCYFIKYREPCSSSKSLRMLSTDAGGTSKPRALASSSPTRTSSTYS